MYSGGPTEEKLAFEKAVEFYEENSRDKLLSVIDIQEEMGKHCRQPWTARWLKKKMSDRFGDSILVCSKNGRKDVIVPREDINSHLTAIMLEFLPLHDFSDYKNMSIY